MQHAHNPVDWFPWGEEALRKAREEDKPILVSIGYAACHWCHVMERESFENPETAALMNAHFVNIKIDREERPDLDQVYMDAVQAIAGQGGWPLNVFLTPALKPFYGGTYFPPVKAFNRSSWTEVLLAISDSFRNRRQEIESQAENLTAHLEQANRFGISAGNAVEFSRETVGTMIQNVLKAADRQEGGFGRAPKFPQSFTIRLLLHNYYHSGDPQVLEQARLSLDKMARGGIYDQLRGGFARYSTDAEWLAPHFEKMLYDNALLLTTYAEAWQLTGSEEYRQVLRETAAFVEAEWLDQEGGFYSALDADSEGVEGKYYVWEKKEIDRLLGSDSPLFCAVYDISEAGNWEHVNILRLPRPFADLAQEYGMELNVFKAKLEELRAKLLSEREKRVRPQLDDKILLGWNALMNSAFTKLYAVFGEAHYLEVAEKNLQFLLRAFRNADTGGLFHTYKNGQAKYPAFLDDYAFLIEALILLQEVTGKQEYLEQAREWLLHVLDRFSEENGFFYFTPEGQEDIVVRKKEIYDGAIPSGNSTMCWNMFYLGVVFDRSDWVARSRQMAGSLEEVIKKYPTSFGVWATNLQAFAFGVPEIALVGPNNLPLRKQILQTLIPTKIFQSSPTENNRYPLLAGKPEMQDPLIYLCKNYTCQNPVREVNQLIMQLENVDKL